MEELLVPTVSYGDIKIDFFGIGWIDPNAVLKVYPSRRIAHVLKLKVKEELDRMVREKVIIKVEKPAAWLIKLSS